MKKKIVTLILATALTASALTACGSSAPRVPQALRLLLSAASVRLKLQHLRKRLLRLRPKKP